MPARGHQEPKPRRLSPQEQLKASAPYIPRKKVLCLGPGSTRHYFLGEVGGHNRICPSCRSMQPKLTRVETIATAPEVDDAN